MSIAVNLRLPTGAIVRKTYNPNAHLSANPSAVHVRGIKRLYPEKPLSGSVFLCSSGIRANPARDVWNTVVRFAEPRKAPFALPFRPSATVLDAKAAVSTRLHCQPDEVILRFGGNILHNGVPLRDACRAVPRALPVEVTRVSPCRSDYVFVMLNHEACPLAIHPDATGPTPFSSLQRGRRRGRAISDSHSTESQFERTH
jgi:hypothetical protein